ncbi:MAG: 3-keto-5-aminohexanoate cleavage protein [Phycisphaerae bacterium]|nr:3-keto-5-aminohexanoate cleavage protein [Phycisphaerae bacterium]
MSLWESDIIIQGSTGGLSSLSLEERCVFLKDPRVEVASLNMGSCNFGDEVYDTKRGSPDIRSKIDISVTANEKLPIHFNHPQPLPHPDPRLPGGGLCERP